MANYVLILIILAKLGSPVKKMPSFIYKTRTLSLKEIETKLELLVGGKNVSYISTEEILIRKK